MILLAPILLLYLLHAAAFWVPRMVHFPRRRTTNPLIRDESKDWRRDPTIGARRESSSGAPDMELPRPLVGAVVRQDVLSPRTARALTFHAG